MVAQFVPTPFEHHGGIQDDRLVAVGSACLLDLSGQRLGDNRMCDSFELLETLTCDGRIGGKDDFGQLSAVDLTGGVQDLGAETSHDRLSHIRLSEHGVAKLVGVDPKRTETFKTSRDKGLAAGDTAKNANGQRFGNHVMQGSAKIRHSTPSC